MNQVQYKIEKVPEDRSWVIEYDPDHYQLRVQVLLPGTTEYQDFVPSYRSSAVYDGSLERLIHRDIHEAYPDAVEVKS